VGRVGGRLSGRLVGFGVPVVVRGGPMPGQQAAGGLVVDYLGGRLRGLGRLVGQGPAQVALLGDRQGGEEHVLADRVDDSGPVQGHVQVVLHASQAQVNAAVGEFPGQLTQAVGRGDVDLGVGFDVEYEPPYGGVWIGLVLQGKELVDPLAQVADVGEEQGSVVAIEH